MPGFWAKVIRTRLVACLFPLALPLLAGCVTPESPAPAPPAPAATPAPPPPSAETEAARRHYAAVEAYYRGQDRLLTDGGAGIGFSASDLARNVLAIAFHDEFAEAGSRLVPSGREARLHRWQGPMRVSLVFGPETPPRQQGADRVEIAAYLSRLSRLTGLQIRLSDRDPNHLILIQSPPERRAARDLILTFVPGMSAAALNSALNMRQDIYCTVFANAPAGSATYDRALTVIRTELPPLLRKSCIHEELAQALGLVNDSPAARPSIFNDDEEYALLTSQDALMLRLIYDPRLRPGMTLDEARPIVETIAAELVPAQG